MAGAMGIVSDQRGAEPNRGTPKKFRAPGPRSAIWDLIPVAVSLVASTFVIIRSATMVAGHRAYLLFDDAAISLTYARNLASGHGLVWIPGHQPVEGYSNFLWTLWMAAIETTHSSEYIVGLWVMITGAALLAANSYVIARIARRVAPGMASAPLLAGLATALYFGLNSWTLMGMETGLVALLSSSAVLSALRACDTEATSGEHNFILVCAGVLLALNVLTRDDALIVAVVVVGFVFLKAKERIRSASLAAAPVVVAIVGHEIFRLAYYGHPVPNTYYLKITGIPVTTRAYRGMVVLTQSTTMQFVVPLVLAGCYFLLMRRAGRSPALGTGLLLGILCSQAAYVVYVGGDSYDMSFSDRYFAPLAPFLFILAVLGALELARVAGDRSRPVVIAGAAICISGIFVFSGIVPILQLEEVGSAAAHQVTEWGILTIVGGLLVMALGLIARNANVLRIFTAAGLLVIGIICVNAIPVDIWNQQGTYFSTTDGLLARLGYAIERSASPETTVAVSAAGNITYFDNRQSIDVLGYSDHFIATTTPHTDIPFQPGHDKWDYEYSIGRLRPDVVVALFHPSSLDLAHMKSWGYRTYTSTFTGTMYYLPGHFNPVEFQWDLFQAWH
ncbi:MAG TPA: hypothetical protein VIH95_05715 [Acidimicrobiales bacterium]